MALTAQTVSLVELIIVRTLREETIIFISVFSALSTGNFSGNFVTSQVALYLEEVIGNPENLKITKGKCHELLFYLRSGEFLC